MLTSVDLSLRTGPDCTGRSDGSCDCRHESAGRKPEHDRQVVADQRDPERDRRG
jgi:hypothetical protein